MLARLSIRDIVLIDQLDLEFPRGLTILTGETGAGKSILLDALSLALGARGDGALVRHGQAQGQVTAVFELAAGHPSLKALESQSIAWEGELILRRVQFADGRTRAFVNDQSVSAQTLRALAGDLVEIHGQHDERALLDSATHRSLVDAYGGLGSLAQATRAAFAIASGDRSGLGEGARGSREDGSGGRFRASRRRGTDPPRGPAGGGRFARRAPSADDAGRKSRRRHPRRPRESRGRCGDPAGALRDLAPVATPAAAGAATDRTQRPGSGRGDGGARGRHSVRRGGARGLRLRSA